MSKKGLTKSQMSSLDKLSDSDLNALIEKTRGNEVSSAAAGNASAGQNPQLPLSEQSSLVQPKSTEDLDTRLKRLAYSNLDQATLESLPQYADGAAPETAIMKAPPDEKYSVFSDRTKLSFGSVFGNTPVEKQASWLKEKYGEDSVAISRGKNITLKGEDGKWYQFDPSGEGTGSWGDKIFERSADIVADNTATGLGIVAAIGATVAAPATATALAAGSSLSALAAAVPGLVGTGAVIGAGTGLLKTSLGRVFGTYNSTPEDQIKDIGLEMILQAGGNLIAPGVQLGARTMGAAFKRGAEKIASMAPSVKESLSTIHSALSGASKESFDVALNMPKEYGETLIKYGKDAQTMLNANVKSTADLAKETTRAVSAHYKTGIADIANEAGDAFTPQIGKEITSQFEELAAKGIMSKNAAGKFILNSQDEIAKLNPTIVSELEKNNAYGLMKDYVNYLNKWQGKSVAAGKDGVEQYFTFKTGVNDIVDDIFTSSQQSGANQTFQSIKQINGQLKSKVMASAVDGTKSPELSKKLATLEIEHGEMKNTLYPLLNAVKQANKKGSDVDYAGLYNKLFKDAKMTPQVAQSKKTIEFALNKLSPFSKGSAERGIESIAESVQGIRLRKAATELTPWLREGSFARTAQIGAVATGNPALMAGAVIASPKVNLKVAQIASTMLEGVNFLNKMPRASVPQLFSDPKLFNQFMTTVVRTPMVADQMKQSLLQSTQQPTQAPNGSGQ